MKHYYSFLLLLPLLLFSCNKEASVPSMVSKDDGLKSFSVVLSKALCNEPELRQAFKREALKRVDYDYDVVISLIRDMTLSDGLTIEETISKYDEGGVFENILSSHPLLTVLIPDWSWVNEECFSVKDWNTETPEVGVGWCDGNSLHPIYCDGKYAFCMQDGEFSTAPILIVKDNDRLKSVIKTKAGEGTMQFISDDFYDLSSEVLTKGAHSEYEKYNLPTSPANSYMHYMTLDTKVREAYFMSKNNSQLFQRDHIYYGLTDQVDSGKLNHSYYERLYAFKIDPLANGCFDDVDGSSRIDQDFSFKEYYYGADKAKLTVSELQAKSWGDGTLEVNIEIDAGNDHSSKVVSVPFDDAFEVKHVKLKSNYNWLNKLKSRTYYIDLTDSTRAYWLESKWIKANLRLFNWDLTSIPTKYKVSFYEHDPASTYTTQITTSYTYTLNLKTTGTAGDEVYKIGYEVGGINSRTETNTITRTYTQADDKWGDFYVYYTDKIVTGAQQMQAIMNVYNAGTVQALMIPIYN